MRGLRIGLFSDDERRDHSYSLRGFRDAFERSDHVIGCYDVTPADTVSHERLREALETPFSSFGGIALDTEFGGLPEFAQALFALDCASALNRRDWTETEMDKAASLPRVVALDVRPWSFYRSVFDREVPLLSAPLPSYRGFAPSRRPAVVIINNDLALAGQSLDEVRRAIRSVGGGIEIHEITNGYAAPAPQAAWLDPRLPFAGAHIHIGQPPDTVSAGRLIDSMNMRAPCIVFDDTRAPRDAGVSVPWRTPAGVNDVNMVRTSSISALGTAIRLVLEDRAWSGSLVRNALREVETFQAQFQASFLRRFTEDHASWSLV
ncbi:hypothetical protein [Muricoccus vinaceus]|uniref:Glycosyltransferase family 1 protein n=1 Tax=Muricoccus vinaceus TaxID=424704 RepID=A0ABV6J1H6_9PROT